MSIQSEINRISIAKADILDALRDKGVLLLASTKISEIPEYLKLLCPAYTGSTEITAGNEIDRISQSKNRLLEMLEAQGAEIPADAKIEDIPPLIEGLSVSPYIQADGGQYILTDIEPDGNTRVVMDIRADTIKGTYAIYGSRINANSYAYCIWNFNDAIGKRYRYDYRLSKVNAETVDAGIRYSLETDSGNIIINGEIQTDEKAGIFSVDFPMAVLSVNTGGIVDSRGFKGKLYSCKIYTEDKLKADFIPAIRYDEVFLIDKVIEKRFYNKGTGTFVFGVDS